MTAMSMMLDTNMLDTMQRLADIMASGKVSIPQHLRGNRADCFAIVMQSFQWGMNPFAVAQKTHLTQGGALGYEAQLISAVITTLAPIKGRPEYEFIGDWSKVLGKVAERTSDKEGGKGGKYYVATYTKADEEGLGVIVRATFIGEDEPREVSVMMSQAFPRFSTQWATDPMQQLGYLAIRKWGRRYTPDVLLGVYTPEELELRGERDMGRAQEIRAADDATHTPARRTESVRDKLAAKRTALPPPSVDTILMNITAATTQQELAHAIEPVSRLDSEDDKTSIRDAYAAKVKSEKERAHSSKATKEGAASTVTYAEIADKLQTAATIDQLNDAIDLARGIEDPKQRDELSEMYTERRALMEG
nr:RecT family recombinase [Paraburkholderia sp. BL8N3]